MFGDVLKQKAYLLKDSSLNKMADNAFWKVLRDIATTDKTDTIHALAKELLNTFTDPELRQFLSELGIEN